METFTLNPEQCQGKPRQTITPSRKQYSRKMIFHFMLAIFLLAAGIISTSVHGATVSASGEILTINLDIANDAVTLVSTGTTYTFTLTTGSWTGSPWPAGVSVSGAVLTIDATGLSSYSTVSVINSAASPSGNIVTFENSGTNAFADNINVVLINSPGQVSFNGASSFTGSNSISIITEKNIVFNSGSGLNTENGDITLEANQQATASSGFFIGIEMYSTTLQITGTGTMSLKGRGGNTGSSQHGVFVQTGSKVIGGTTGLLSIEGYGGITDGNSNIGVTVGGGTSPNFSTITSNGCNVLVKGVGGGLASSASARNIGILIGAFNSPTGAGMITSGGSGTVTLDGIGGVGATGSNDHGVCVHGPSASVLSGGTGSVSIIGTGGMTDNNDANNLGVYLRYLATITTGINGSVSITGIGGCSGKDSRSVYGVYLIEGSKITSQGSEGIVTVNGTGGATTFPANHGVYVRGGTSPNFSTITSGGGNVSVTGTGGGIGSSGSNFGVFLNESGIITSGSDGFVSVTGNGGCSEGTGSQNFGVYLYNNGKITSGGAGNVTVTGIGGNSSGNYNYGVQIKGGTAPDFSTITSGGGNVTVTGTGRGTGTSSNQHGVYLGDYSDKSVITSGGTGSVTVIGKASKGTTGTDNIGVYLMGADAKILSGGSGSVSVTGTGGGIDNSAYNPGVRVSSGTITSGTNGPVNVTGQGGCDGGTGTDNAGIEIRSGGTITSSGIEGTVTVTGTGSNSSGYSNHGVMVNGGTAPDFSKISSGGGHVTITGIGGGTGSSSTSFGVLLGNIDGSGSCLISAGETGSLTINGQGGAASGVGNYGVFIMGANARVLSAGNITITATEGGSTLSYAMRMMASSSISSTGTGSLVKLIGNSIDLATGTSVSAPDGRVNILPRTTGVNIDLGSVILNKNGPLTFTNAALGFFSADTITFGSATSDTITISQDLTASTGSSVKLITQGTGGVIPSATADFSLEGRTLTFGAGTPLRIAINGTTVNTTYKQLSVNGAVKLDGAELSLSGTYTPDVGDVFTIVSATSITGTFNGLPDDAEIIFNTKKLKIAYTATSVTLTPVVECNNPTDGGEIEAGQTICSGTAPAGLTNKTTPTGYTGTLQYKWQSSTTSASADFEDINPAATDADYSPGALTATTWFKRLVKADCGTTWFESNVVEIIVIELSRRYITVDGAGSKNGLDWLNAYDGTQLQAAINETCVNEVWVAAGIYKPTTGDDRNISFVMKNGVAIYGGFSGSETNLAGRNWATNATILSGDLLGDDGTNFTNNGENSYHVIYNNDNGLNNTAILDGFTIKSGNANGSPFEFHDHGGGMFNYLSGPSLTNCIFSSNSAVLRGGGMHNQNSSPSLTNCIFSANKSMQYGGGMKNEYSNPNLINCTFMENAAGQNGGGMDNNLSSPNIINCTFYANTAIDYGGGIENYVISNPSITNCTFIANTAAHGGGMRNEENSNPNITNCTFSANTAIENGGGIANVEGSNPGITNCIVWGNTGGDKEGIINDGSTPTVTYSIVQGASVYPGESNLLTDPLFVDAANPAGPDGIHRTADDGISLQSSSPAIDAGDPATTTPATDITGFTRDGVFDIGAYEYHLPITNPTISITSPTNGSIFYTNPVTISGTAADADGNLSLVEVRYNAGSWQTVTGTYSWTIDLNLEPGLNTLEARAKDARDLYSDIAGVEVTLSIQIVSIPQGWSYISSYLEPIDPNIVNMWADIVGANNLMILTGINGIYAPAPFYINTLNNWDVMKGYKVKMNVADDLIVSGDSLTDKTVNFPAGVHLIPVLTNQTTSLDMVFDSPSTDILYMLDIYSNLIYWPGGILYTLTDLVPGRGYLANFKNPVTLSYPPLSNFTVDNATTLPPAPGPWPIVRTSNVHLISVSTEAISQLQNADYLGAFDSQGNCVGYAAIEKSGTNLLLTIYGDEPITSENDGMLEGEMIHFKAYNSLENAEKELTATFNPTFPNADGLFVINGLSGISGFKESATGVGENDLGSSVQVYPNPAKDELNISLKGFGTLQGFGTLMNTEGKLVKTFTFTSQETQLDVSDFLPGIYMLQIVSTDQIVVKRIVIQ